MVPHPLILSASRSILFLVMSLLLYVPLQLWLNRQKKRKLENKTNVYIHIVISSFLGFTFLKIMKCVFNKFYFSNVSSAVSDFIGEYITSLCVIEKVFSIHYTSEHHFYLTQEDIWIFSPYITYHKKQLSFI